MTLLARALALPSDQRRLTMEAVVVLAFAGLLLRLLPFRLIARMLGRPVAMVATSGADHAKIALAVGLALDRGARALPWRSNCLVRALAGRLLLARRGVPCTVHFGVRRQDGLGAHAWLIAAGIPVSGAAEAADFTPIAAFSNPA